MTRSSDRRKMYDDPPLLVSDQQSANGFRRSLFPPLPRNSLREQHGGVGRRQTTTKSIFILDGRETNNLPPTSDLLLLTSSGATGCAIDCIPLLQAASGVEVRRLRSSIVIRQCSKLRRSGGYVADKGFLENQSPGGATGMCG